jgi:transposase InsO family protein
MRGIDLQGLRLRRRHRTTIPDPAAAKAADLIGRDFTAQTVNQRYVGDITYLPVGERGFLYLAIVIDLHSRRLAGYAIPLFTASLTHLSQMLRTDRARRGVRWRRLDPGRQALRVLARSWPTFAMETPTPGSEPGSGSAGYTALWSDPGPTEHRRPGQTRMKAFTAE